MINTQPNGMYKVMIAIQSALQQDEALMRLLYYYPEDIYLKRPDPLDPSLYNIIITDYENATDKEITREREILENRFKTTPTASDIEGQQICRIYLYTDDRNPTRNYKIANQNFNIDIFCHESFEADYRTARILDRINDILLKKPEFGNPLAGMGAIEFVRGRRINVVKDYSSYTSTFVVGAN